MYDVLEILDMRDELTEIGRIEMDEEKRRIEQQNAAKNPRGR